MLKECPKSYKACTNEINLRKGNQSIASKRLKNTRKLAILKTKKMRRNKLHKTK